MLGPDDDAFAVDSKPAFVPSSKEINKSIDIDLRETDTIWMFILPGTCKEIEGDEDVQRTKKRKGVVVCCYILLVIQYLPFFLRVHQFSSDFLKNFQLFSNPWIFPIFF